MSDFQLRDIVDVYIGGWGVAETDTNIFQGATITELTSSGDSPLRAAIVAVGGDVAFVNVRCLKLVERAIPKPSLTAHKHKDTIIAWANGESIQVSGSGYKGTWMLAKSPSWNSCFYRVTPEVDNAKITALEGQVRVLEEKILSIKENRE